MWSPLTDCIDQWSLIEESSHCASVYLPNYFEALVLVLGSTELTESTPWPEESGTCMQGWLMSSSEFITWPEVMMLLDDRACPVCATFLLLRSAIPDRVSGCMGSIYFPSTLQRTSESLHVTVYIIIWSPYLSSEASIAGKRRLSEVFGISWSYPSLHPTLRFWVSTVLTQPITRTAEVRWRVKQWTFPSSLCSTHLVLFGNVVLFSLEHTVFLRGFFTHWNLNSHI